jgi:hypothetical protein
LAEYNEKNNAIAQGFEVKRNFTKITTVSYSLQRSFRAYKKYDEEAKLLTIYNKNKQNLDLLTTGAPTTAVLLQKKLSKAPADTSFTSNLTPGISKVLKLMMRKLN